MLPDTAQEPPEAARFASGFVMISYQESFVKILFSLN